MGKTESSKPGPQPPATKQPTTKHCTRCGGMMDNRLVRRIHARGRSGRQALALATTASRLRSVLPKGAGELPPAFCQTGSPVPVLFLLHIFTYPYQTPNPPPTLTQKNTLTDTHHKHQPQTKPHTPQNPILLTTPHHQ